MQKLSGENTKVKKKCRKIKEKVPILMVYKISSNQHRSFRFLKKKKKKKKKHRSFSVTSPLSDTKKVHVEFHFQIYINDIVGQYTITNSSWNECSLEEFNIKFLYWFPALGSVALKL